MGLRIIKVILFSVLLQGFVLSSEWSWKPYYKGEWQIYLDGRRLDDYYQFTYPSSNMYKGQRLIGLPDWDSEQKRIIDQGLMGDIPPRSALGKDEHEWMLTYRRKLEEYNEQRPTVGSSEKRFVDHEPVDPFGDEELDPEEFKELQDPLNKLLANGDVDAARVMLDQGYEPKKSSVYFAAKSGLAELITALLYNNRGKRREHIDMHHKVAGQTPLHMAVLENNHGVIDMLRTHGVNTGVLDRFGRTAIDRAVDYISVRPDTLHKLIENFPQDFSGDQLRRVYQGALQLEDFEKLQLISQHMHMDPAELAVLSGNSKHVAYVLDHSPRAINLEKINKLLRFATQHDKQDVVKMLLERYSADPYMKVGADSKSAWDVASPQTARVFCQKYFNESVCSARHRVTDIAHDTLTTTQGFVRNLPQSARRVVTKVGDSVKQIPQTARGFVVPNQEELRDVFNAVLQGY